MKPASILVALALGLTPFFGLKAADSGHDSSDKVLRLLQQSTLALLKEGNVRHMEGQSQHPNQEPARRLALAKDGQEPLVTIVSCSDSRVPVEQVFDRGVGDVFVVRVAGNVAGTSEMASVEYGVGHLGTPVLLVLGHTKCGAVTAVVKGAELHGHLAALAKLIKPAAHKALGEAASPEDAVPIAIQFNVWQQIENLLTDSPELRAAAKGGKVLVVGAVYDIASGKVAWLGQHPQWDRIMAAPMGDALAGKDDHGHDEPAASVPAAPTAAASGPTGALKAASPGPVPHPAQAASKTEAPKAKGKPKADDAGHPVAAH